jgi:hypothetical protein
MAGNWRKLRVAACLAGFVLVEVSTVGASLGADRRVTLKKTQPLSKDVEAAPKIERPRDAAERRINKALAAYDESSRRDSKECQDNAREANAGGTDFEWLRSFRATMRGPGYLSFAVSTYGSCGGAHPWAQTASILFDLRTGGRANWSAVLPSGLAGRTGPGGANQSEMPSLASKRLRMLYLQAYRAGDHADDKQCLQAVETTGDGELGFQAWLDEKAGGLAYVMRLSDFDTACMDEFVLPLEVLRAEGAPGAALRAIAAAHRISASDQQPK